MQMCLGDAPTPPLLPAQSVPLGNRGIIERRNWSRSYRPRSGLCRTQLMVQVRGRSAARSRHDCMAAEGAASEGGGLGGTRSEAQVAAW